MVWEPVGYGLYPIGHLTQLSSRLGMIDSAGTDSWLAPLRCGLWQARKDLKHWNWKADARARNVDRTSHE